MAEPSSSEEPSSAPSEEFSEELSDRAKTRRRLATAALLTGTFLASLDVTVVSTAMPKIASELSGTELYGWVFSSYLFTSTTTMLVYGKLADRWGRRRTFLLGVALLIGGSVLCALSPTMSVLVIGRGIQGLGGGAILPLTTTIFGDLYPPAQRAKLQALFSLTWGASAIIGPPIGATCVELFGWPSVFYLNVPVGLLAGTVLALTLTEPPPTKRAIDWAGAVSITVSSGSLLLGLLALREEEHIAAGVLIALGLLAGAYWWRTTKRAIDPVLPPKFLVDEVIGVGALCSFLLGGLLLTLVSFIPLMVQVVWGGSIMDAGIALIPTSLSWTLSSFVAGHVMVKWGYRVVIRTGTLSTGIGGALIACSLLDGMELAFWPGTFFTGGGMGFALSAFYVSTQERVPYTRRGAATALLVFSRSMGGTAAVSALGLVLAATLEEIPPTLLDPETWGETAPDVLREARGAVRQGLMIVFGLGALSALLSFVASLRFPQLQLGATGTSEHAPDDPD